MALAPSMSPPACARAKLLRHGEAAGCGDSAAMPGQDTVPPSWKDTHRAMMLRGAAARGTAESGGTGGEGSALQGEAAFSVCPNSRDLGDTTSTQPRGAEDKDMREGKVEELTWTFLSPYSPSAADRVSFTLANSHSTPWRRCRRFYHCLGEAG